MLKKLDKFSLPELETQVLEFWKEAGIFKKTLEKTKKGKEFVFYEGPPTANGHPGIHHVIARGFKDAIPRYKTMRGFHVPRKGGWDTHGLPVELQVEKELGLKSKKEIEEYGVAAFNRKCRESVWKYKDEWERLTERMGFWLDLENPYITYKNEYISVVWQIVREAWKKKLLYKGYKVLPWCTRCGTALSSHELAQGYKLVKENSVYLKFRVKGEKDTFILSWTTTPWTLPGNVALAVGKSMTYVKAKVGDEWWILAKERAAALGVDITSEQEITGEKLIGLEYEPLFNIPELQTEKSHRVYAADFVTTTDGTGVVHTAVMYGEDDYNLGKEVGLPQFHTVAEDGRFIASVPEVGGMKVKIPESDGKIIEYLKLNGNYLKEEKIEHDYPFCWRCSTPLLYYARGSWFIRMSDLRKELVKENSKIHWIPEHIRDGRFGEWLREAKDWAISRERYWGTPLPIWECEKCGSQKFVAESKDFESSGSGNTYILCRHGEAESNVKGYLSSYPEKRPANLTEKGRERAGKAGESLKKAKIDMIFASDVLRTKQTAEIISAAVGVPISFDARLRELDVGELNGGDYAEYLKRFPGGIKDLQTNFPGGESRHDARMRMAEFIAETEEKYKNKKILVVSHEYPLWTLKSVLRGNAEDEMKREETELKDEFFSFASPEEITPSCGPRDESGAIDFHKPYIDKITFPCECGGVMHRTPEVLDVWFDSGSMPWAQNGKLFNGKKISRERFPAEYISEGVDQTRGWFYTLLAIGTFLGEGTPYRNAISLGHILDSKGQKMSKSKGNMTNPWEMMDKYGADVVRWHFYTVNPPGESKRFDERELVKVSRALFMILYNSWAFWDLYADTTSAERPKNSKHILDKWILSRFDEAALETEKLLDVYDINRAAKAVEKLSDDISRWYIRRSRRRLQRPEHNTDFKECSQTLGFVLSGTAKLLAPFAPFFAEALYKSISPAEESVHLAEWPKVGKADMKLIAEMEEARNIASAALAKRAEFGIKVRQPLSELRVKAGEMKNSEITEILKDEVNVKNIFFAANIDSTIEFDTNITPELKEEGILREVLRAMQEYRQEKGFVPKDKVPMRIAADKETIAIVERNKEKLLSEVNASEISCKEKEGELEIS